MNQLATAQLSLSKIDCIHDLNWFKSYPISLSLNSTSLLPLSQINSFTDGSKTNHHTGAGFVIYRQGTLIAEGACCLPLLSTVFQAEISAIQMATQALTFLILPTDRYLKIFTDSQASLFALNSSLITSQPVSYTHLTLPTTPYV